MPIEDDQQYRGAERRNGPTLSEYLEKRLTLLDKHLDDAMEAMDLRYEQRFQAQQTANATALLAVKEALKVALDAATLAVNKAEHEAGLRFTALSEKIGALEARFNTLAGELIGGSGTGKSLKSDISLVISALIAAIVLWRVVTGH